MVALRVLTLSACAGSDNRTVNSAIGGGLGGATGGAVGAELGGRDGAIIGSGIGAAVGTAISTSEHMDRSSDSSTGQLLSTWSGEEGTLLIGASYSGQVEFSVRSRRSSSILEY